MFKDILEATRKRQVIIRDMKKGTSEITNFIAIFTDTKNEEYMDAFDLNIKNEACISLRQVKIDTKKVKTSDSDVKEFIELMQAEIGEVQVVQDTF